MADVRTGKIEILQGTDDATIEMRIMGSASGGGGAGHWTRRRERFAVLHLEHAENGESVLCLCESETIRLFVEFNPKKARSRTKVFKPKMSLKGGNELVDWG